MDKIAIDIGRGYTKVKYGDKLAKFPTAVAFYTNNGITYGDQNVYEFKGQKFIVGSDAVGLETFSTTDFKKFFLIYSPMIIYHILRKFDEHNRERPIQVNLGLALVDWDKKDEYLEAIRKFEINGQEIEIIPKVVPQGVGIYMNYAYNHPDAELDKKRVTVIDIGSDTINVISMNRKKFQPQESKSYTGHGVLSLVRPFKSYLENKFSMKVSDQEAMEYVITENFTFYGKKQEDVIEHIKEEKKKFAIKIFNSVLVEDKNTLSKSDIVILSGGGSYLFKNTKLPDNFVIDDEPMEYSNVMGYHLL